MGTSFEYAVPPGHLDKVGKVFTVMSQDSQTIALPAFVSQCQFLRMRLSTETLTDMFNSNATTLRGSMTFAEFKVLAEQYPTMLDSLFVRLRDFEEDERQQQRLKDLREEIDKCRAAERGYAERHHTTVRSLDATRGQVEEARTKWRAAEGTEEEVRAGLKEAVEATQRRRERFVGVQQALSDLAEEDARCRSDEETLHVERSQRVAELQAAEAEAAELHKLWEKQLAVVEERARSVDAVAAKEERLRAALDDVARRIHIAQAAAAEAEQHLAHSVAQEEAAATRQLQAHNTTCTLQDALEKTSANMPALEQQAATVASYIASCRAQAHELARRYEELERENADFNAQRLKQSIEMSTLLEEEVAIRKQRVALENREARLRAGVILKQSEIERHKIKDPFAAAATAAAPPSSPVPHALGAAAAAGLAGHAAGYLPAAAASYLPSPQGLPPASPVPFSVAGGGGGDAAGVPGAMYYNPVSPPTHPAAMATPATVASPDPHFVYPGGSHDSSVGHAHTQAQAYLPPSVHHHPLRQAPSKLRVPVDP